MPAPDENSPAPIGPPARDPPRKGGSKADTAGEVFEPNTIDRMLGNLEHQGQMIGPYRLLQVLGEGGFGVVWLAERREPMVQRVALKVIKPGMDTKAVVARFEQERQALALMDHPNLARIFDGGVSPSGRPYFVMEYVQGESITSYCDRHRLTTRQRLELFVPVCEALQHAHMKGIIHRDIKPSNILVSVRDGQPIPKVIDFGVAKAINQSLTERTIFTETGQLIGTPEYMSPEQAEMGALDIDTRTDVYSLGVVLYELLSGFLPFDTRELRAKGFAEIQRIIREVDPPTPSKRLSTIQGADAAEISRRHNEQAGTIVRALRKELEWVPLKAIRKDRSQRYASAESLAADVRRFLAGKPLEAGPETLAYQLSKLFRRYRGQVAAGALVVVALGLGLGGVLWEAQSVRAQRLEVETAQRWARTTKEFVKQALAAGDPSRGGGARTTVAEAMREASKKLATVSKTDDPLIRADLQILVGEILLSNGHAEEAQALLEPALESRKRLLTGDHADVAEALNDLGVALKNLGKESEASSLFREAARVFQAVYPGGHADTAIALGNLGTTLTALDKASEGEVFLGQALEMDRRLHPGSDDVAIVEDLNNLGQAKRALGKPAEGEPLFQDGLSMSRRLHVGDSANHPQTAVSLNNVASALVGIGKGSEAEPLFVQSLAMYRRIYPGDHPRLAEVLSNLGTLRGELGRPAEGEPLLRDGLAMQRKLHNDGDHADVAQAMHNLGCVLQRQGKLEEAEEVFEKTVEMRRRLFGPDRMAIVESLESLAIVREQRGELIEAEEVRKQALEMEWRLFPSGNTAMVSGLQALAKLRERLRHFDDVETTLAEAVKLQRSLHPGDHADVGRALQAHAHSRLMVRQNAEAEGEAQDAAKMFARLSREGDPWQALSLATMAVAQFAQQKEGATKTLADAVAMVERTERPAGEISGRVHDAADLIAGKK